MAALPDDSLKDLHPQSTREWFMYLNSKIDAILESQADDRETIADYMQKTNDWIKCHDATLHVNVQTLTTTVEKVDQLEKKVNVWNVLNSLGVAVAAILAALGLKGS